MENTIVKIDKLDIKNLKFGQNDVLQDEDISKKQDRWHNIQRGMMLGNNYKVGVKIIFKNAQNEVFETEATIWGATENNIMLKNNVLIPVRAILEVIV